MEWKDGNDTRVAWFQCHEHMQKMYDKVKKPRMKIDVRYKYPDLKPEEKPKQKVTTTKKPASKKPAATKKAPAAKKTTEKPKKTRKKRSSSRTGTGRLPEV